jgi:hypothetical protein
MREDAADAVRQLAATPPEQAEDEHEQIQQVEIDRHRGEDVIILAICTRANDAPRVEHEQAAEDEHADRRQEQPTATLWKKMFKTEATSSTIKPTKKNAPHALKSRRLKTA